MTNNKDDGGSVYPQIILEKTTSIRGEKVMDQRGYEGMSLRAYAAIELKEPDSGIDWLDEMIVKSKRDSLAGMAMQGLLSSANLVPDEANLIPKTAYIIASAMIKGNKQ